jgi:hypothetical protein
MDPTFLYVSGVIGAGLLILAALRLLVLFLTYRAESETAETAQDRAVDFLQRHPGLLPRMAAVEQYRLLRKQGVALPPGTSPFALPALARSTPLLPPDSDSAEAVEAELFEVCEDDGSAAHGDAYGASDLAAEVAPGAVQCARRLE